jgi:hypothetical protein
VSRRRDVLCARCRFPAQADSPECGDHPWIQEELWLPFARVNGAAPSGSVIVGAVAPPAVIPSGGNGTAPGAPAPIVHGGFGKLTGVAPEIVDRFIERHRVELVRARELQDSIAHLIAACKYGEHAARTVSVLAAEHSAVVTHEMGLKPLYTIDLALAVKDGLLAPAMMAVQFLVSGESATALARSFSGIRGRRNLRVVVGPYELQRCEGAGVLVLDDEPVDLGLPSVVPVLRLAELAGGRALRDAIGAQVIGPHPVWR